MTMNGHHHTHHSHNVHHWHHHKWTDTPPHMDMSKCVCRHHHHHHSGHYHHYVPNDMSGHHWNGCNSSRDNAGEGRDSTWYIPFPILTRKTWETLSLLGHIGNFLSLCFIFFYWWWFLFIFITIICSTAVVSRSPPPQGWWAWHSTPNLNRQYLASVFTYALILWISDLSLVVFN